MLAVLKLLRHVIQCASLMVSALFFMDVVYAEDNITPVNQLEELSKHSAWQHLIFVKRGWPEITSNDFYLSDEKTSQAELIATLKAFQDDKSMKCKFPARYYWLSRQLNVDFLQQGLADCEKLSAPIQEVGLLLIGGYMKNPASTFGHMLVNVKTAKNKHRLVADTYNYGGDIPMDESALPYMFKGVFGLYDGAFNKDLYSRNDDIYTQRENRDIWEYTLDVTEDEKRLLTYHLDELTRFKFNYYFFKQNCAYRTAELLEFIDNLKLTQRKTPWYFPEYVISHLLDWDEKQSRKIIKSEEFRPSNQTANYEYFKSLTPELRQKINLILKSKNLNILDELPLQQREQAFYFLIHHTENRHKINPDLTEDAALRKALVRKRIDLPEVEEEILPEFKLEKTASVHGPKPSKFGLVLGSENGISFSMYQRDPLNETIDLNTEFKVLDGRYIQRNHDVVLNLNLVEMSKLSNVGYYLEGMRNWSWRLKTGLEENPFEVGQQQFYGQAEIGAAYSWSPTWLSYQMVALSLHDQDRHADFKTITGLLFKNEQWSGQIAYEYIVREQETAQRLNMIMRKKISKNVDTRLNFSKQRDIKPQVSLGLNYYW